MVCARACIIGPGDRGTCRTRMNVDGVLRSLVYGRPMSVHVDPIEKKPLFHFLPGTLSYTIATVGCNLRCRFCQNADIAQMPIDYKGKIMGNAVTAQQVVEDAAASGCSTIAYTYTEPTVFFEFAYDTAKMAHTRGIRNVFVTNGYMTSQALEMMNPYLDAANVDLKSFSDEFYQRLALGGTLQPVLDTLVYLKRKTKDYRKTNSTTNATEFYIFLLLSHCV